MDIRLVKKELRNKILAERDRLSESEREEKSCAILSNFIALEEVKKAEQIFIFVNFRTEVNTKPIISYLIAHNKKVIVPYTDIANKRLRLFYLNDINELKIGSYNILEPDPNTAKEAKEENIDLAVVPGSAFDVKGGRMGYGGGFYDRLLPKLRKDVLKIAVAFELQIVDEVPRGYYDQLIDMIVTEKRVIIC